MIAAYGLPPPEWPLHNHRTTSQWVDVIELHDGPLPAVQAIASLSTLPGNWDGLGSPPIAPTILTRAIELLTRFGAVVEPLSHASPVSGGGLQLEWYLRDRYLEVEVLPDGSLQYLFEVAGQESEEGALLLTDIDTLRKLVGYLSHR